MKFILQLLFFTALVLYHVHSFEREITVNVEAGKEDCFYQHVTKGEVIDFDYQVIDGGNLDITFRLLEPTEQILVVDFKKPENTHRVEAAQTGDYKFCFDNTFSTYNSKTVVFEMIVERDGDEWSSNETVDWNTLPGISSEDVYEMKVQDIQEVINRVHTHLNKARHYQMLYKTFEARDRNVGEENYFKVNTFSFLQVIIMISVGIVQVVMVKSLFDDTSRVNMAFKKYLNR